jgi:hypothetical protein
MSDAGDDDIPQLSSHTLAALQEFYAEQNQHTDPCGEDKYNIGIIEENWVSKCSTLLLGNTAWSLFCVESRVSLRPSLIPESLSPVTQELITPQGSRAEHSL